MIIAILSSGLLPARYVLALMGCLGVTLAFMMRGCLSIAIIEMTGSSELIGTAIVSNESCLAQMTNRSAGMAQLPTSLEQKVYSTHDEKYNWDEPTQGLILASFYYGYTITHVPGSILAQKFGGKHTLSLGLLSTALLTLFTPMAASLGPGWMVGVRFLEGVGEGTTFPALCTLLSQWSPINERSFMATLVFSGVQIGAVLGNFLSGLLMSWTASWHAVFYWYGGGALLWFILWCVLCFNDPKSHPYISTDERLHLFQNIGTEERRKDLKTPWGAILCSVPVWALIIGQVGSDYGFYLISTDLPKYMSDVIGLPIAQNGILSSLPFLLMWFVALITGALADYCTEHTILSRTGVRKIYATLHFMVPAVGALVASYSGCNSTMVGVSFTLGMSFMGFCHSSLRVNPIDLSPNFSATIMSLSNGMGCISGMIAPLSVGFIAENKSLSEWRIVFWIMFTVLAVTNVVFVLFGSGDVQPWNDPKELAKDFDGVGGVMNLNLRPAMLRDSTS